jgi:glycerophosphoryl diester phosphodiesterase
MKFQLEKVIGHRGACGHAPENTLVSMSKAHELGIKWVEFDVKLAKCGELVIFHDSLLERTTNGMGSIANHDFLAIADLDCGSWFSQQYVGEKIPTFKQLLSHVASLNLGINVEIKPCEGKDLETALQTLDHLMSHWPVASQPPLISSFSKIALQAAANWHFPLGYLINCWDSSAWEEVLDHCNCIALHVDQKILTPQRVAQVKKKGLLLLAYTVNDTARATELFSWGVDAVFSDFPDRILLEA